MIQEADTSSPRTGPHIAERILEKKAHAGTRQTVFISPLLYVLEVYLL